MQEKVGKGSLEAEHSESPRAPKNVSHTHALQCTPRLIRRGKASVKAHLRRLTRRLGRPDVTRYVAYVTRQWAK